LVPILSNVGALGTAASAGESERCSGSHRPQPARRPPRRLISYPPFFSTPICPTLQHLSRSTTPSSVRVVTSGPVPCVLAVYTGRGRFARSPLLCETLHASRDSIHERHSHHRDVPLVRSCRHHPRGNARRRRQPPRRWLTRCCRQAQSLAA